LSAGKIRRRRTDSISGAGPGLQCAHQKPQADPGHRWRVSCLEALPPPKRRIEALYDVGAAGRRPRRQVSRPAVDGHASAFSPVAARRMTRRMRDVRHPQISLSFSGPVARDRGQPGGWEPFKLVSADVVRIPIAPARPGTRDVMVRLSPDGSLYALGVDLRLGEGEILVVSLESGQLVRRLEVGAGYGVGFTFLGTSSLVVLEETKRETYLHAIDLASGRVTPRVAARWGRSEPDGAVIWSPQVGFLLVVSADGLAPRAFVEDHSGSQPRLLAYPALGDAEGDDVGDVVGAAYEDGVLRVDFGRPVERREHFHIGVPSCHQRPELIFGESESVLCGTQAEFDHEGVRVIDAPGSDRWGLAIHASGMVNRIDRLDGSYGPDCGVACVDLGPVALMCNGRRAVVVDRGAVVIDTNDGSLLARWPLPRIDRLALWEISSAAWGGRRMSDPEDRWALVPTGTGWVAIDADCAHDPVTIAGTPCRTVGACKKLVFSAEKELLVGELPRLRAIILPEYPRGVVVCRDEALAAIGDVCVRVDLQSGRIAKVANIVAATRAPAETVVLPEFPRDGSFHLDIRDGGTTLVIGDDELEVENERYEPIRLEPPVAIDQTMHRRKLIAVSNDELRLSAMLALANSGRWSATRDSFAAVAMDGSTLVVGRPGEILRIDLGPHLDTRDAREPPPPLPRAKPSGRE